MLLTKTFFKRLTVPVLGLFAVSSVHALEASAVGEIDGLQGLKLEIDATSESLEAISDNFEGQHQVLLNQAVALEDKVKEIDACGDAKRLWNGTKCLPIDIEFETKLRRVVVRGKTGFVSSRETETFIDATHLADHCLPVSATVRYEHVGCRPGKNPMIKRAPQILDAGSSGLTKFFQSGCDDSFSVGISMRHSFRGKTLNLRGNYWIDHDPNDNGPRARVLASSMELYCADVTVKK